MKLSTEIQSIAKIVGMEKALQLCAGAGFDGWDFSMFDMCQIDWGTGLPLDNPNPLNGPGYLKFARQLKQIGLDNGIVCNQSHAPHPVGVSAVRGFLKRAIECTAEAGGRICVIHPDGDKTPAQNAEMYAELLPFAKECGVKLATENMWNWDSGKDRSSFAACATGASFAEHIDLLHDSALVACLDIGHAEMQGSGEGAVSMIRTLGHRLQALHIHDNDRWHDCHQIPGSMDIDFDAVIRALKEVGYSGWFTLEAYRFLEGYTEETVFDGVKRLRESVARLEEMFLRA